MNQPDIAALTDELIAAGRFFHTRGWVPATGGNFSVRLPEDRMLITASGGHKGELTASNFLIADLDGRPLDSARKASYETLLHSQIYRRARAGAVLHTHSVANTVLSRRHDKLNLAGYELLKVLDGVTTHDTGVQVPVFENDQDIARLSAVVDDHMARGMAQHGYLIRGHGLYAWGETVSVARHRVEALEFMFECESRSATR